MKDTTGAQIVHLEKTITGCIQNKLYLVSCMQQWNTIMTSSMQQWNTNIVIYLFSKSFSFFFFSSQPAAKCCKFLLEFIHIGSQAWWPIVWKEAASPSSALWGFSQTVDACAGSSATQGGNRDLDHVPTFRLTTFVTRLHCSSLKGLIRWRQIMPCIHTYIPSNLQIPLSISRRVQLWLHCIRIITTSPQSLSTVFLWYHLGGSTKLLQTISWEWHRSLLEPQGMWLDSAPSSSSPL